MEQKGQGAGYDAAAGAVSLPDEQLRPSKRCVTHNPMASRDQGGREASLERSKDSKGGGSEGRGGASWRTVKG